MATPRASRAVARLRARAIANTLFPPTTLARAVARLGFVQADPIRAPARAQDLILRPRVRGYRVGDLDAAYPDLELEEGMLYAYGTLPREVWSWLHPRRAQRRLNALERKVLGLVPSLAPVHPRDLDAPCGRRRATNGWGGQSQATKLALDQLHRRGLLRVAGRRKGIRLYAPAGEASTLPAGERLERLARHVATVFAPAPLATVRAFLGRLGRGIESPRAGREALARLVASGALRREAIDGVDYLLLERPDPEPPPERVRLLAPFDPLVHDRARFEHLWGWAYRFEAYVPKAQRVRGYYALPLLWRDRVVGWANLAHEGGVLTHDVGYVTARPRGAAFRRELEAELARVARFLRPRAEG